MIVKHMPQGWPEWFEARRGRPTASNFNRIITAAKGELSKSSRVRADGQLLDGSGRGLRHREAPSTSRPPRPWSPASCGKPWETSCSCW